MGLVGESASGKTTAALTFPNPVVCDFDDGLTAHLGKSIVKMPFGDDNWCVEKLKAKRHPQLGVVNKRDAFKTWLGTEAIKLTLEQTLIIDSWTTLQNAFDRQTELEPAYTKGGQIDEFAFWARKIEFSRDIMEALKGLVCNVVVCFHELKVRDEKTGLLLDKVAPLMQGKFIAQIPLFFSDFFRQVVISAKNLKGEAVTVNGQPIKGERGYFWQIKPDAIFTAKTRMSRQENFIPATYESFSYGKAS